MAILFVVTCSDAVIGGGGDDDDDAAAEEASATELLRVSIIVVCSGIIDTSRSKE